MNGPNAKQQLFSPNVNARVFLRYNTFVQPMVLLRSTTVKNIGPKYSPKMVLIK